MNILSDTLRELMDRNDLTGAKLSEEIGVSVVSVGHILTGKSSRRQVTLSRKMKRICDQVFIVVPELDQGLREALSGEASIRAAESQNLAVEIFQLLHLALRNQETEGPRG